MRQTAGIGFIAQALLFLAALFAPSVLGNQKYLHYVNDQSVISICLIVFGLLLSTGLGIFILSKREIRNDGRVVVIISQALICSLMLLDGAFVLYALTMLPFFLAFKFWRSE